MANITTYIWLILTFFCLVLELGNPGLFYFLSIAIGSFMAAVASMYDFDSTTQYAICFSSSVCMLFVLLSYVKKSQKHKSSKMYQSNIYQLIGKTVEITEVTYGSCAIITTGYGKVNGEIWQVRSQNNKDLTVGMLAIITGVQGCHLQINSLPNDCLSNDSSSNNSSSNT